jgi:hypothetical protein
LQRERSIISCNRAGLRAGDHPCFGSAACKVGGCFERNRLLFQVAADESDRGGEPLVMSV